jgi:hypothetical protein
VHHLCTHYNTQVHFLTASQYQSWQKSFLLFSEVRSDRNLGCRLNLRDSGLPEIFGWIIMYSAYTPLSGAEGADDGESFMWSHGRVCNMLFMMKIDNGLTLCW